MFYIIIFFYKKKIKNVSINNFKHLPIAPTICTRDGGSMRHLCFASELG